jgi:ABC-type branched-subunit amino acid transport system ATPase component/ABC-type branched-subunit amino acid transport system permease subunit
MGDVIPAGPATRTRPVIMAMQTPQAIAIVTVLVAWVAFVPDYLVFSLTAAIPVAIIGLGLLVLQGWVREISLASAGLYATAIYYFNWLHREGEGKDLNFFLAAGITLTITTTLMAGIALVSTKLPSIYLIVLTLGLQITLEKTVFNVGVLSGGTSGGTGGAPLVDPRPEVLGISLRPDTTFYFFALAWLGVILAVLIRLRRSPMGLAFFLVGQNRQAAAAVGIPPVKFRVLAFATAGLLCGLGGILASLLYVGPPLYLTYRVQESLLLLAIPVLAGVDSMASVLVVSSLMVVTPIALERWRIDQLALAAIFIAVGALFGARGIGGRVQDGVRRWRYGERRIRVRRKRAATELLRTSVGLAHEKNYVMSEEERAVYLRLLEEWLPPRSDLAVALTAEDIRLAFGPIKALNGATISVPAGSMVGLIGPNGAGKTTIFDVISGFTPADSGRVELFGTDVTRAKPWDRARRGMSRTFQNTRVMPELSVADNMLAGVYQSMQSKPWAFMAGSRKAWGELRRAEEVALAAARLLDVDRYWDERVATLEFSARRRIEIARALLAGPRLLLLDEPAAGLDPASSTALFNLIKRLHSDLGLTVLIVEHYVKAVLDTCDYVYVLAQGAVLSQGTPVEVAGDPVVQQQYLGTRLRYLDDLLGTDLDAYAVDPAADGVEAGGPVQEQPAEEEPPEEEAAEEDPRFVPVSRLKPIPVGRPQAAAPVAAAVAVVVEDAVEDPTAGETDDTEEVLVGANGQGPSPNGAHPHATQPDVTHSNGTQPNGRSGGYANGVGANGTPVPLGGLHANGRPAVRAHPSRPVGPGKRLTYVEEPRAQL